MALSICAPVKKKIPGDAWIGFVASRQCFNSPCGSSIIAAQSPLTTPSASAGPNLDGDPKTSTIEAQEIQKSALCGIAP